MMRTHAPQVVFLDVEAPEKAAEVVTSVEESFPGIQFVAVHRTCDQALLLEAMRMGMREFISLPFKREPYFEMVTRVQASLDKRPPEIGSTNDVFSFLPAKAGVGTSTIALNAAAAISRQSSKQVLLLDLDLNSGMLRFMLKLHNQHSLVDATEMAERIDENLWPQLVSERDNLHVLHSGKVNPEVRMESIRLRCLLAFARRNYEAICLDLSGNLEKFSIEAMHESKRIFLVCTPEIPSLHLAREKFQYLQSLDLEDKIRLIVNRSQKSSVVSTEQIERLLQLPVETTFPNDYSVVQRALHEGRVVEPSSELGRQFEDFAASMTDSKTGPRPDLKRKRSGFLSFPGRFNLFPDSKKTTV
jgi:pilus assembly protein CpaE